MGLAEPVIRRLAQIHRERPFTGPALTLGVQHLGVTEADLPRVLRDAGLEVPDDTADGATASSSEPDASLLLHHFGINACASLDRFGTEGATVLHDLTVPVPSKLRNRFGLIIDGGTIEHVFDVAAAFRNVIDMLRPGGRVVHVSPVSGWENHGFYSINPKLLHAVYRDNGFHEIQCDLVHLPKEEGRGTVSIERLDDLASPFECDSAQWRTLCLFVATRPPERTAFAAPVDTHQAEVDTTDAASSLRDDLLFWEQDETFNRRYAEGVEKFGNGPRDRYYVLKELLTSLPRLDGDTAECGVFKGLGSYLMCQYARSMTRASSFRHHLFDSFEGMSAPTDEDAPARGVRPWQPGDMTGTLDEVRANLADFGECEFHAGWIPHCFESARNLSFSFVHIDVDLYEPTRDAVKFFFPRLVPGGIILFDDDGFLTCPGARRAVEEFESITGLSAVRLPTGQAFVIRNA